MVPGTTEYYSAIKKEQTIDNTTWMDLRDKKNWKNIIIPKGCILYDSIYVVVSSNKITEMKDKVVVTRG